METELVSAGRSKGRIAARKHKTSQRAPKVTHNPAHKSIASPKPTSCDLQTAYCQARARPLLPAGGQPAQCREGQGGVTTMVSRNNAREITLNLLAHVHLHRCIVQHVMRTYMLRLQQQKPTAPKNTSTFCGMSSFESYSLAAAASPLYAVTVRICDRDCCTTAPACKTHVCTGCSE